VSDVFLAVEAAMEDDGSKELASVINAIRIFRIARLFRLVRFLKGLNQLTMAFILSVPKLVNVAFIMLLLIYLFAVLGVNLFAEVAFIEGGSYDENANFRTFWKAMSLLIRSMTGEGWNFIMHDLSKDKFFYESYLDVICVKELGITKANFHTFDLDRDGVVDPEFINGCGQLALAFTYFITYTLIVTFVILNLFIAVIFEGFEESSKSDVADLLQKCVEAWKRYDPDSTMLLPVGRALDFIDELVEQACHHQAKDDDPAFSMESRWDPAYSGMRSGEPPLALYSLHYMRIVALRVTPSNEVRFVVCVKAVIRRLICQGGLNSRMVTHGERLERLRELDQLDRLLLADAVPPALLRELTKLKKMEQKQARAIHSLLDTRFAAPALARIQGPGSGMFGRGKRGTDEEYEYSLLHEVAAAKIQRRAKEAFQRRCARERRQSLSHSMG